LLGSVNRVSQSSADFLLSVEEGEVDRFFFFVGETEDDRVGDFEDARTDFVVRLVPVVPDFDDDFDEDREVDVLDDDRIPGAADLERGRLPGRWRFSRVS